MWENHLKQNISQSRVFSYTLKHFWWGTLNDLVVVGVFLFLFEGRYILWGCEFCCRTGKCPIMSALHLRILSNPFSVHFHNQTQFADCVRASFCPPATPLHSEMWAKSILKAASCRSKDNITSNALLFVNSFTVYQHHIDKSHLKRQYWMSNQRSFLFTNSFPVYTRRGFLIRLWCNPSNSVVKSVIVGQSLFYSLWMI